MQPRSPWGMAARIALSAGAFAIAWLCETRREMNRLGARIPSPWLLVVPVTAVYWAWCWAEGVQHVTGRRTSAARAFALLWLGPIGLVRVQCAFNRLQAARTARAR
ncbi:MAG TPA: hypothetical protein VFQ53_09145 [Kofleriaceae bacterium]|nr:hypothetical protein [Kofleriaceae bacterium]